MKTFRIACLLIGFVLSAGSVWGDTTEPFSHLFTALPDAAAKDTHRIIKGKPDVFDLDGLDLTSRAAAARTAVEKGAVRTQDERDQPPRHTGFAALVHMTAADFKAFPRRQSTWVILGIGAGAAALSHPLDDDLNEELIESSAADKVLAAGKYAGSFYVQLGTATGLYIVGRYVLPHAEGELKTNRVSHLGFDMFRALIVSQALTQATKYATQRDRPTGECCAFPSGHASAAFATASVLERHLGYRGAWPTFVIAGYVAASRLQDNRHFLSDVLFGSALGIASGWTVVGRHGRSDYALMPVPTRGGIMIAFRRVPRSAADGGE